jgi:anti-anti-sigma factor
MRDLRMTVSSHAGRHPETVIVEVVGPLTLPNIFSFQDRISFLRKHSLMRALAIDLKETPYIDSAGLGCLINCYVSAEKKEIKFYLSGANERIKALLETAHVEKIIRCYPTIEDVEYTLGAR